ncbi:TOBE domain-containing protein [bacterium]|nr:TOBE domain-containing protein [bacterium]
MLLPALRAEAGEMVSVSLRPADVALVLQPVAGSSIQNQWEGEVASISADRDRAVALVRVGAQSLHAELSTQSVADLALEPGKRVWCLFKARAVRCLDA